MASLNCFFLNWKVFIHARDFKTVTSSEVDSILQLAH